MKYLLNKLLVNYLFCETIKQFGLVVFIVLKRSHRYKRYMLYSICVIGNRADYEKDISAETAL